MSGVPDMTARLQSEWRFRSGGADVRKGETSVTTRVFGAGNQEAFLGGVPKELLFDQMCSVIVEDHRREGGPLVENPEFVRFAHHWEFRTRACRPYRAKTKGKVERPIRYVRGSFFYGRHFINDDDLDAQLERWLSDVANVRLHRTTKERPIERFARDERATLRPLVERIRPASRGNKNGVTSG